MYSDKGMTMIDTPPSWYVLRVEPGREQSAEEQLNRRGIETYLPLQTVWRRPGKHSKEKLERRVALMVGYAFANVDGHEKWPRIHDCGLVHAIIGDERGYYRLRDDIVPELRRRFGFVLYAARAQRHMRTYREFKVGDWVTIADGPFRSDIAPFKVEKIKGNAASILMHLFGAITEVKVPLDFLEAA